VASSDPGVREEEEEKEGALLLLLLLLEALLPLWLQLTISLCSLQTSARAEDPSLSSAGEAEEIIRKATSESTRPRMLSAKVEMPIKLRAP